MLDYLTCTRAFLQLNPISCEVGGSLDAGQFSCNLKYSEFSW